MAGMERKRIMVGDCLESMRSLPDSCVSMCVTSPPYYALRDYGTATWEGGDAECDHNQTRDWVSRTGGLDREHIAKANEVKQLRRSGSECAKCGAVRVDEQIGLEKTPELFIARLVEVFQEVKRILRDDGTCWVNMGDSYGRMQQSNVPQSKNPSCVPPAATNRIKNGGVKEKDLLGIPWRLAFALQADGWYLRSDIIWHKLNPMPESVTDRPTKAHEYLFLFSKSKDYYYDAEAIREAQSEGTFERFGMDGRRTGEGIKQTDSPNGLIRDKATCADAILPNGRNRRTVWSIATAPYAEAHFATYPPKLIEPCILAGTSEHGCCPKCLAPWERQVERVQVKRERPNDYTKRSGADGTGNSCANSVAGVDVKTLGWLPTCKCGEASTVPAIVFDPFGGSGTTAQVARALGRDWLLCELNPAYAKLAEKRARTPLYGDVPKAVPSCPGQTSLFGESA